MTRLVPTVDSATWLFPSQTMTALGTELTPTDEHIDTVIAQYLIDNPPSGTGAVDSVNGQVGTVTLDATDVGAKPSTYAPASTDITDASTIGKALLTAVTQEDARTAIGAGTGSGSGAVDSVNGKTGVVDLTASDVGAKPDTYAPTSADITDATAVGKAVLIAADMPAARAAIGAGTSSLVIGTGAGTAADAAATTTALGAKVPATRMVNGKALSADISLTAADVGASTLAIGTTSGTAADAAAMQAALDAQLQIVVWDATNSVWPAARASAVCRFFISTGSPAATTPTGLSVADKWFRDGAAA